MPKSQASAGQSSTPACFFGRPAGLSSLGDVTVGVILLFSVWFDLQGSGGSQTPQIHKLLLLLSPLHAYHLIIYRTDD